MKLIIAHILLFLFSQVFSLSGKFIDRDNKQSVTINDNSIVYNTNEPRPCSTNRLKTSNKCDKFDREDISKFEIDYGQVLTTLTLYGPSTPIIITMHYITILDYNTLHVFFYYYRNLYIFNKPVIMKRFNLYESKGKIEENDKTITGYRAGIYYKLTTLYIDDKGSLFMYYKNLDGTGMDGRFHIFNISSLKLVKFKSYGMVDATRYVFEIAIHSPKGLFEFVEYYENDMTNVFQSIYWQYGKVISIEDNNGDEEYEKFRALGSKRK
jgi:hypothetical protein